MIRRSEQYNSDYMSRAMDERLEQLEERLTALYANAALETQSDFYNFMEKYKKDYLAMLEKLDAEEITKAEFDLWCSKKILKTTQYKEMLATLTNILVNTDVAAMAIIRGKLPFVVAQSYNFAQSLGFAAADKAGLSIGTFQVYNAWSVQKIIKDNPKLLPNVDIPLDRKWNNDKINTAITHSIIHGDSIPKVAKRLREVTNMDKNSAIRNARTSMTGAENLGRNESIKFMKKNGVPVQLMWSATHDSRTRDTHLLLDRTFQNEKGYFGEGILSKLMKFPGDPEGLPQEIYNCRCRASIYLEGIDHSKDAELYDKFMTENYPDDYKQLKEWEEKTGRAEERRQTLEYQKVLKEIHKTGYYDSNSFAKNVEPKNAQSSFIPAQTVEEAQQRAREAGAIYSKFDGWNIDRANNALEAIERLPEDCRPKAVLNGRDTAIITDRSLGRKASSWYGVTYDYRPFTLRSMYLGFDKNDYDGGQVVGLNVQNYKTLEKLTSQKIKTNNDYFAKNGRYWFFNTRGEATAHHEMGHCLFNVRIAGNDNIRSKWERVSQMWYNESNCDLIKKPEEAFAEAWAAVSIGDEERLPSYIIDFVRRYL